MMPPAPWAVPMPAAAAAMGEFSTFHTFVMANIPDFTACCRLIGTLLTARGLFTPLKTITRGHPRPAKVVPSHTHRQLWLLSGSEQSELDTRNKETRLISLKCKWPHGSVPDFCPGA